MKRLIIFIISLGISVGLVSAQTINTVNDLEQRYKSFSVIGDSYSTFLGKTEPTTNVQYYPREGLDVYESAQTWWMLFQRETGIKLEQNNSFSGGTICNTWWNGEDASTVSFVYREQNLRKADLIIIEGGTNDSNAGSPIGSFKYADWTYQDLKSFRPALAKTIDYLKNKYPDSQLLFMLNNGLKADISSSVATICEHYDVPVMTLSGVEKAYEHPTYSGMQAISTQLINTLLGNQFKMFTEHSTIIQRKDMDDANIFFHFVLHKGQWNTICLPFDLTTSQIEEVFGEGAVVASFTGETEISKDNANEAVMYFSPVDKIVSGQPYIVLPTITRTKGITLEHFNLKKSASGHVAGNGFMITGTYMPMPINATSGTSFVLQADGSMYHLDAQKNIGSMHAYFTTPDGITRLSWKMK